MTPTPRTAACTHTNDFEFSLGLPFDPQGRDDRPEDDAVVTCWQCKQQWTKAQAAPPDALREMAADWRYSDDMIGKAFRAALAAPAGGLREGRHSKHDDWWCECGLRVEDCDDLQAALATFASPSDTWDEASLSYIGSPASQSAASQGEEQS